jgi:hypothetical protein
MLVMLSKSELADCARHSKAGTAAAADFDIHCNGAVSARQAAEAKCTARQLHNRQVVPQFLLVNKCLNPTAAAVVAAAPAAP